MAAYATKTKMEANEVIDRAVKYFGEGGYGLETIERSDCCVRLQGGGGHIDIFTELEDNKTEVKIETREWDRQVRKFLQEI